MSILVKIQVIELYHILKFGHEFSDYAFNKSSLEHWFSVSKLWLSNNNIYFFVLN